MLFGMVNRGMENEALGDKGKARSSGDISGDRTVNNGEEAMWAVLLTKDLWRKRIWYSSFYYGLLPLIRGFRTDAKSVSIIELGCFHPVVKVQNASILFFLSGDNEQETSDDEDDVRLRPVEDIFLPN
jgi:protein SDA1